GADQHHFAIVQRSKDLFSQLDGRVADRNRAHADFGLATHALSDGEGASDHGVEESGNGALLFGGGVGRFELSEDLRLADDHRVEAGGYAEDMADGVLASIAVDVLLQPGALGVLHGGEELFDAGLRVGAVLRNDGDFDAIAGGENHALHYAGFLAQLLARM